MAEQGFHAAPDRILLTDSGTQAIDLVCRMLVKPGDVVLVDDPCYFNFLALLRAHQVTVIGVPHTPGGPGSRTVRAGARGASAAPLHHQFRPSQPDRRDASPPARRTGS